MEEIEVKDLKEFSLVSPETEKFWENKNGLASKIKGALNKNGNETIFYQSVGQNCVRLVSKDQTMFVNFMFNSDNDSVMTTGVFKSNSSHDVIAFSVVSDGSKEFAVKYSRGYQTKEGAVVSAMGMEKYSHDEYYSIENSVYSVNGLKVSASSEMSFTEGEDYYTENLISTDVNGFVKSTMTADLLKFRSAVESNLSSQDCYKNGELITNSRAYDVSEICENIARTNMFKLENDFSSVANNEAEQ